MYKNTHCNIAYHSGKLQAAQMPINRRMDEYTVR